VIAQMRLCARWAFSSTALPGDAPAHVRVGVPTADDGGHPLSSSGRGLSSPRVTRGHRLQETSAADVPPRESTLPCVVGGIRGNWTTGAVHSSSGSCPRGDTVHTHNGFGRDPWAPTAWSGTDASPHRSAAANRLRNTACSWIARRQHVVGPWVVTRVLHQGAYGAAEILGQSVRPAGS
jgi:hypothetical protein